MRLWSGQLPQYNELIALVAQFVCFMIDLKVYAGIKFAYYYYQFLVMWFKFYVWITTTSTDKTILYAIYNHTEYDITPHVRYFYKTHPQDQHTCWRLEKFLTDIGVKYECPLELVHFKRGWKIKSIIDLENETELISKTDLDFGSIELDYLKGETTPLI
jgi:hypothetical protein